VDRFVVDLEFPVDENATVQTPSGSRDSMPMSPQWYFTVDGKRKIGPVSSKQLRELAASGTVQPENMVLKLGAQRWVPAFKIRGLFPEGTVVDGGLIASTTQPQPAASDQRPSGDLAPVSQVPANPGPAEDSQEKVRAEEIPDVLPASDSDVVPGATREGPPIGRMGNAEWRMRVVIPVVAATAGVALVAGIIIFALFRAGPSGRHDDGYTAELRKLDSKPYPPPRSKYKGMTAREWYQLATDADYATSFDGALALRNLGDEGTPFLLDGLDSPGGINCLQWLDGQRLRPKDLKRIARYLHKKECDPNSQWAVSSLTILGLAGKKAAPCLTDLQEYAAYPELTPQRRAEANKIIASLGGAVAGKAAPTPIGKDEHPDLPDWLKEKLNERH
jgi:hypothetical protein